MPICFTHMLGVSTSLTSYSDLAGIGTMVFLAVSGSLLQALSAVISMNIDYGKAAAEHNIQRI